MLAEFLRLVVDDGALIIPNKLAAPFNRSSITFVYFGALKG